MNEFNEVRFMDPDSKTPQQLIEYLVEQQEPGLLKLVLDLLRFHSELVGENKVLKGKKELTNVTE